MSVLQKETTVIKSIESIRASQVVSMTRRIPSFLIDQVEDGLNTIWNSTSPSDILTELGTSAVEIFKLNEDLVTFLATQCAGTDYESDVNRLIAKMQAIPANTKNADGTITLD